MNKYFKGKLWTLILIYTKKHKKISAVKLVGELTKAIEEYENTLNFGYLQCLDCHSDELISYGTYERNVVVNNIFIE